MPSTDPSVFDEPHFQKRDFVPDPSETEAAQRAQEVPSPSEDQAVEHSVFDEPALAGMRTADPAHPLAYANWLERKRAETTFAGSWCVTLGAALVAGPFAVVGAFVGPPESAGGIIALTIFGPLAEEMLKVATALWLVEKKPYLFRSPAQILVCAAASGFAFAALENLLYLHVYVPHPSPDLVAWRWTVCVALHVSCTLLAHLGVLRMWRDLWARRARPNLALAYPFLLAAWVLHGLYNTFALLLEFTGSMF